MKKIGAKEDDGLEIVNKYLEKDWKVKFVSACAVGGYIISEKT